MSIRNDIREYADTAIEQGRQVLDQAQGQLGEVAGQATELVGKTITDLRAQAERLVNVDALRTAAEPYLAQADSYRHSVTDRAGDWLNTARNAAHSDPRIAKAYDTAEAVTVRMVETVQLRVVKPVQAFAGRGVPTQPAGKPSPRKPATTRPANAKASTKPATKASARTAAKSSATAQKVPTQAASTEATTPSAKKTTPRRPGTD